MRFSAWILMTHSEKARNGRVSRQPPFADVVLPASRRDAQWRSGIGYLTEALRCLRSEALDLTILL